MVSIHNMLKRIAAMVGTKDLTDWESDFIRSIQDRTANNAGTLTLSSKQIECLQKIFNKHFAA
jgi:hypothetical protein